MRELEIWTLILFLKKRIKLHLKRLKTKTKHFKNFG